MKKTRYLNDEEKQFIIDKFQEGFDTVQIGKMLNRADNTVGNFLRKMVIPLGGNNLMRKQFSRKTNWS